MNTTELKKQSNRLTCYLELIEKTEKQFSDVKQRVCIEENKPYLMAYLTTSRDWFDDRADYLENKINWENRAKVIIEKLNNYGN